MPRRKAAEPPSGPAEPGPGPRASETAKRMRIAEAQTSRSGYDDLAAYDEDAEALEQNVRDPGQLYSYRSLQTSEMKMKYLASYMVMRDIQRGALPAPLNEEQRDELVQARFQSFKEELPEEFHSYKFWSLFLHTYAINGHSKIGSGDYKAAYTNTALPSNSKSASKQKPRNGINEDGSVSLQSFGELQDDEIELADSLPPPPEGTMPLSLETIKSTFAQILLGVKALGHAPLSEEMCKTVRRIIQYHAVVKRWYTTANVEKTWVTREQQQALLSAIWFPTAKNRVQGVALLSLQTAALCLMTFGFRQLSWLDDPQRPAGVLGTYFRWHRLVIRFLDYDEKTSQPQFIVMGATNATKYGRKHGDAISSPFQLGTRAIEGSISGDLAANFVTLAVISDVMPDLLWDVIQNEQTGNELLANHRPRHFDFRCKSECANAPVFVWSSNSADPAYKHELDAPAPGLSNVIAMRSDMFRNGLKSIGDAIGIQGGVTAAALRRTWSLLRQLEGVLKPHEIAREMQHYNRNKNLHRDAYQPTYRPVDGAAIAAGGQASSSSLVTKAMAEVGSAPMRPTYANLSDEQLQHLEKLVQSYLDVTADKDESTLSMSQADAASILELCNGSQQVIVATPSAAEANAGNTSNETDSGSMYESSTASGASTAETSVEPDAIQVTIDEAGTELLDYYAQVTGDKPSSFTNALLYATRILDDAANGNNWHERFDMPHPFDDICGSAMINIVVYCVGMASHKCLSCLGDEHFESSTNVTAKAAQKCNDCYVKLHGKSYCFLCWELVSVNNIVEHVLGCFDARVAHFEDVFITGEDNNFPIVSKKKLSRQKWEGATWYLCPCKSCIDKDMRRFHFGQVNRPYKDTAVRHYTAKDNVITGKRAVQTFHGSHVFLQHLAAHVSSQSKDFCVLRKTLFSGKIMCIIMNCSKTFANTRAGEIDWLCHTHNDHKLPIIVNAKHKPYQRVAPADFGGRLPGYRKFEVPNDAEPTAKGLFFYQTTTSKSSRVHPDDRKAYLKDKFKAKWQEDKGKKRSKGNGKGKGKGKIMADSDDDDDDNDDDNGFIVEDDDEESVDYEKLDETDDDENDDDDDEDDDDDDDEEEDEDEDDNGNDYDEDDDETDSETDVTGYGGDGIAGPSRRY